MADQEQTAKTKGVYGKRPLWQWVVIYLIIGGIIYALIYYFVFARNGNGYGPTNKPSTTATTTHEAPSSASNIYQTKSNPSGGTYLTDFQGMTLYTYNQDSTGVSNCTGSCATTWPPYTSGAVAQSLLPANITVITRADGSKQFAWKGMPLYYYSGDSKAGDINGDGLAGFSVAK